MTASATDPANPAPLLLITSPLVEDLLPGATVTLDVPGIEALTGRATNWLSVDLIVLAEASWLAPYSPAGAWFSDAPSGHQAQRGPPNQPDWAVPGLGSSRTGGRAYRTCPTAVTRQMIVSGRRRSTTS